MVKLLNSLLPLLLFSSCSERELINEYGIRIDSLTNVTYVRGPEEKLGVMVYVTCFTGNICNPQSIDSLTHIRAFKEEDASDGDWPSISRLLQQEYAGKIHRGRLYLCEGQYVFTISQIDPRSRGYMDWNKLQPVDCN